jgi:hypothetical protein
MIGTKAARSVPLAAARYVEPARGATGGGPALVAAPWYARISPISWLLVDHVQHSRSNLDFSSWSTDQDREPTPPQRLEWICRQTRNGTMPPRLYRLMHRAARLTSEEQDRLCRWTEAALSLVDGTSVEAEDTT